MRLSKTLFALSALTFAAPLAASNGVMVEFSLNKSELASTESRQVLLDRMTQFATAECKASSFLMTRNAVKSCADDLMGQFLKEIGDDGLTLLAEAHTREVYRSASR